MIVIVTDEKEQVLAEQIDRILTKVEWDPLEDF